MSQITRDGKDYIGYEYKEITADAEVLSYYIDGYENFGWEIDDRVKQGNQNGRVKIGLKRDRKILNKVELTRLQQHFEACMDEISALKKSETSQAMAAALVIGLLGTAFMAGSTFAVTNHPPMIGLCIVLAIPGFLGWICPYFVYRKLRARRRETLVPLLEQKYEEIYGICERGNRLLN